jgi:hypothetical protein
MLDLRHSHGHGVTYAFYPLTQKGTLMGKEEGSAPIKCRDTDSRVPLILIRLRPESLHAYFDTEIHNWTVSRFQVWGHGMTLACNLSLCTCRENRPRAHYSSIIKFQLLSGESLKSFPLYKCENHRKYLRLRTNNFMWFWLEWDNAHILELNRS